MSYVAVYVHVCIYAYTCNTNLYRLPWYLEPEVEATISKRRWGCTRPRSEYQSLASIFINLVAVIFGGPYGRLQMHFSRTIWSIPLRNAWMTAQSGSLRLGDVLPQAVVEALRAAEQICWGLLKCSCSQISPCPKAGAGNFLLHVLRIAPFFSVGHCCFRTFEGCSVHNFFVAEWTRMWAVSHLATQGSGTANQMSFRKCRVVAEAASTEHPLVPPLKGLSWGP